MSGKKQTAVAEEAIAVEDLTPAELAEYAGGLPSLNVDLQSRPSLDDLISDSEVLGMLLAADRQIDENREELSHYVDTFAEMVINDGDATESSKEAFVNLVKVKVDLTSTKIKLIETIAKLKKVGKPVSVTANQTNNITNISDGERRAILKQIAEEKKEQK